MFKFIRATCGALCGLIMLCSFGANVYATGPCESEVLHKDTTAYAMPKDLKFSLTLKKGQNLGAIPKNILTEESALKEVFEYTLDPEDLKGIHSFEKDLVVQAVNGQKYQGLEGKPFKLDPPTGKYVAKIPSGMKLIKKGEGDQEKYELADDLKVDITPTVNIRVTLKLVAQTEVERIPDLKTSSMGTTLTVEPKRAPLGGYVKLTVEKKDFDFGKARFAVCLRLHGKDEASKKKFFASDDVELQKANTGEAVLRVRIPEQIDGLGGVYFAQPVDLLVVASIPGEADGKSVEPQRAEVMTQEFSVSSRRLAVWAWILAFVLPWFVAAFVRFKFKSDVVEAAQTNLTTAEKKLEEAKKTGDTAKKQIDELTTEVEKQKEDLEKAKGRPEKGWKTYKAELNPIWMVSGKVGEASLSLAQILLWSILVFSASFYVLVVSGKLLDLTNDILILLGITGGASVIAKIMAASKEEKGQALAGVEGKEPKWLDLIQTEGRPDLYKFQMALFTVLAAFFVTGKIYGTLEFPVLPAGLLTLIGISNGVYLTAKATSKTVYEKLDDKDKELKKAEDELKKAQDEAGKRKEEAGKATADKKEEANKAKTAADNLVDELNKKVEILKKDIKNLKEEASK